MRKLWQWLIDLFWLQGVCPVCGSKYRHADDCLLSEEA